MLWINPEAFGRGRNLDCTSSQDSTRCESCLATEHEILSAGRWFIFLLRQLGGNGKLETPRTRNGYRLFPPFLCQQIPEHFSELLVLFICFFFCYCNDLITWRSAEKGPLKSTRLVWMESYRQWSMLMLSFAWVFKLSSLLNSGTSTRSDQHEPTITQPVAASCISFWAGACFSRVYVLNQEGHGHCFPSVD